MGAQESGLTLEALAQRLEALERENDRMRSENAELRSKVATLEGSGTRRNEIAEMRSSDTRVDGEPASVREGRVSRRSLLSKAGAAAVVAVGAGTLLGSPRQAKAHVATNDIDADTVTAHYLWVEPHQSDVFFTPIVGKTTQATKAIEGSNMKSLGTGVEGYARSGSGVVGITDAGRFTGDPPAVNQAGVKGDGPTGVSGVGFDAQQAGVKGKGHTGVWGITSTRDYAGVYGEHKGAKGIGTVGIGKGVDASVLGRSPDGDGVRGEGKTGVYGTATSGYGGRFEGGKAQLMLKPGGSAGKPTTGTDAKGEIYMDSAGTLFVCTASTTSTTAAKWRKLSTTAV